MMAATVQALVGCSRPAQVVAVARPVQLPGSPLCLRSPVRMSTLSRAAVPAASRSCRTRSPAAPPAAAPVEVFQLAGEAGMIGGTAALMFAMTIVGLALGFVLLRVESLVEEGQIKL